MGMDNGTADYPLGVQVDYGGSIHVTSNAILRVVNAAPSATLTNTTLSPATPVAEGGSAKISFSQVSDPSRADNSSFRYSFDFDNDGIFEPDFMDLSTEEVTVPSVFLREAGIVTVRATVTDRDGGTLEAFTGIRVAEVAPILILQGAATSTEGESYQLDLSASDPGRDTINRWTIDWGDGHSQTVDAATASLSHVFADNGDLTIRVTAQDKDGVYSSSLAVAVANVAPTITLSGPEMIVEGDAYELNLSSYDPGSDRIDYWDISWGDGIHERWKGDIRLATHRYADDSGSGNREIMVIAVDEDGSFSTTRRIKVENAAPTTQLGGSVTVNEGGNFTLQIGPAEDRGTDTVIRYMIDWGDGSAVQSLDAPARGSNGLVPTLEVVHAFSDGPTTRIISVWLTDEDGTFANTTTLPVEVRNVAPLAQLTNSTQASGGPVNEGGSATVSFVNASDPSAVDAAVGFTYSYDFDNDSVFEITGSTTATAAIPTHFLNTEGTRIIRGVITDKDGGMFESRTDARVQKVKSKAPTLILSGAGNTVVFNEGTGAVVAAPAITVSDVDSGSLASAHVAITSGFIPGDILAATTAGTAISASYDADSGVLTLRGIGTLADYQAVLQSVAYRSTSPNPANYGMSSTRSLAWQVNDGLLDSNPVTSAVHVVGLNQAPVLAGLSNTATFTKGAAAVAAAPAITISDVDSGSLASARVAIISGFIPGDILAATTAGTSLSASYDADSGVLTLRGIGTLADYQAVLQSVTFRSSSSDPTNGGRDLTRTLRWNVNDGEIDSRTATSTVTVVDSIQAPVLQNPGVRSVVAGAGVEQPLTWKVASRNPNPSPTLRFDLLAGPAGATLDPVTGVITWVVPENHPGGLVYFSVRGLDGELVSDSLIFSLAIFRISPTTSARRRSIAAK
jgi:hypothetical protein